ncbi:MAG TPA: porin family protein [Chitinophagaceae bacterium]|jgi:hypothetical protein
MKKLLLSAGIILLVSGINLVNAQVKVQPGIKGGVSFSSVTNLKGDDRVTGHGGIFVNTMLNSHWSLQPELLYSAQGQKFNDQNGNKNVLALDYVQLPVMLQYHPVSKVYLEAGPQVGLLVNGKIEGPNDANKADVKDSYRKADFGVNVGLGINATKNIGIYGRYNLGVTDIAKSDAIYRQNRDIQVGAAIKF